MLTRHLYRTDEVRAALSYAIKRGRAVEAIAWCRELIDTDNGLREAWATLVEAWMWHVLAADPTWLYRCVKATSTDPEVLLRACWELAHVPGRDSSLWWLLVLNGEPVADTFQDALRSGNVAGAWGLVVRGAISEAKARTLVAPSSLPLVLTALGIPLSPVDLCASIILSCSPRRGPRLVTDELPPPISDLGRRSRREFAIPLECLYGITQRGCSLQSTNNLNELRLGMDAALRQSPFWRERLLAASQSDDALEDFYQTYFPDDIPDEWSRADQMLSHGPGLLRSSEQLSYAKLGRIWFSNPSRFTAVCEWPNELDPWSHEPHLRFENVVNNSLALVAS